MLLPIDFLVRRQESVKGIVHTILEASRNEVESKFSRRFTVAQRCEIHPENFLEK